MENGLWNVPFAFLKNKKNRYFKNDSVGPCNNRFVLFLPNNADKNRTYKDRPSCREQWIRIT